MSKRTWPAGATLTVSVILLAWSTACWPTAHSKDRAPDLLRLAKVREPLSYAVFRAAGVPAPRTAYAEVTLTVPGKYDKEYVGLYTLVEQVDKVFLKDRFKKAGGLLVKPEGLQGGLPYLGEDWK